MPAHRKKPLPPARMVELLAERRRVLVADGLRLGDDDPTLAARADRVDRRRWRLIAELEDLDGPEHAEVAAQVAQAGAAFDRLLVFLPAMTAFEEAWQACWAQMVTERAWPHNTAERRAWRAAMLQVKPEFRATFLGHSTPYQRWRQVAEMQAPDEALVPAGDLLVGAAVA